MTTMQAGKFAQAGGAKDLCVPALCMSACLLASCHVTRQSEILVRMTAAAKQATQLQLVFR